MEKTSKVKSCEFTKEWVTPQNATLYIHKVVFENNEEGNYYHIRKMPTEVAVGKELTYTMNDKLKLTIVKQVEPINESMTKKVYQTKQSDIIGLAFSYAKDILVAAIDAGLCTSKVGKLSDDLIEIAVPIYDRMSKLKDDLNKEEPKSEQ
jgi:hypothetical protein